MKGYSGWGRFLIKENRFFFNEGYLFWENNFGEFSFILKLGIEKIYV